MESLKVAKAAEPLISRTHQELTAEDLDPTTTSSNPRTSHIIKYHHTEPKISGSRPTIFTHLSSTSYESMQAAAAKTHLKDYFAIRVDPPVVIIPQYEPG